MSAVEQLMQLDIIHVLFGIIVIAVACKFIWEIIDFWISKSGLEFKGRRVRKEDQRLLYALDERVTSLEKYSKEAVTNANVVDKELQSEFAALKTVINQMASKIDDIYKSGLDNEAAMLELLYDTISQRCHHYLDIGYIPEDEHDQFVSLLDRYKGLGGNHGLEKKVNYCINNLPIKSVGISQDEQS